MSRLARILSIILLVSVIFLAQIPRIQSSEEEAQQRSSDPGSIHEDESTTDTNTKHTNTKNTNTNTKTKNKKKRRRPHILLIVMDDLGSHDLGFHGTHIQTPNTDALARSGVYLDQYYVTPYCSPTRAALLSGKYPLHTGVSQWIRPNSTAGLPLGDETLAQVLKQQSNGDAGAGAGAGGYATHAVGKWHVGHSSWEQTPTWRGFDSFYGFYGGGEDYFTHSQPSSGYDMRSDPRPFCDETSSQIVDERGNYSTHIFTREAIRVIERHHDKHSNDDDDDDETPLFLYLAFQAVHCPNQVPQEYMDRYAHHTDWTEQRKNYAGMLTAADEGIGNVTRALQETGLWENTLVIFTTDNGGPTESCCVQGSSNYPKRGGKCTIWEGGTTGDGFLSGPAVSWLGLEGGRRFPHLFHVVDWLPTLAEMIGVVPTSRTKLDDLDGKSHWGSLTGQTDQPARNQLFVGYVRSDFTDQWYGPAVRIGNWKLIQGPSGGPDADTLAPAGSSDPVPGGLVNSTYLLFDLSKDPGEDNNIASLFPNTVQRLRYALEVYQQSYVTPQPNDDTGCPFTGLVNTSMGPTL
jgi:arylsulfatase A-like enzyme